MYDLILRHGTLVDGTGAPARRADLAINGDRVAAIGDLSAASAAAEIDAAGKTVAPGFVDTHNHSDGWLLAEDHLFAKTSQGFTTEVIMADGISYAPVDEHTVHEWLFYMRALNGLRYEHYDGWRTIEDYMQRLDGNNAQNAATHIPYANVRAMAWGWGRQAPDDYQMRQIQAAVEEGMEQGAVGLSTGLDYISECFATTDELVEACRPMAAAQGLYVTHVRYKKGTLEGVQEAVEIGRRAGVPVHISHLKGTTPAEIEAILRYIDEVAVNEVDFSFDVYPYLPGSTMLNYMLPYEVWEDGPLGVMPKLKDPTVRARFAASLDSYPLEHISIAWLQSRENAHWIGRKLSDYVEAVGRPAGEVLADLLIEEHLAVLLVFHHGDDSLVHPFLAHDKYVMGTDGIHLPDGAVHPRMYGSSGRLLGPCVRRDKLFSLEAAVAKLSGLPAARFGLVDRGVLAEGKFADIVVFDAETVSDQATYDEPTRPCTGIEWVAVNGVPVVKDGAPADLSALPGRWLKFNR